MAIYSSIGDESPSTPTSELAGFNHVLLVPCLNPLFI